MTAIATRHGQRKGCHRSLSENAGLTTELSCDQVRGLGDDEMARDKLIGRLNDFDAGDVVGVSVVRCGEKDSGVNDEHDQSRPNPSANISSASRAPRPDVDEPIPTNASLRRGAAAPTGKLAAISAMSWSTVIPRRFDSAWRRARASAGRSSVTVMSPMLERKGDIRTGAPGQSSRMGVSADFPVGIRPAPTTNGFNPHSQRIRAYKTARYRSTSILWQVA
jgi:hypothetical protein